MNRLLVGFAASLACYLVSSHAMAAVFSLPQSQEALIGQVSHAAVQANTPMMQVGEKYDVGFNALQNANPQFNLAKPLATQSNMQIPEAHLLPNMPRQGIIVNLPEMRMYYFLPSSNVVYTFPVGIGKIGNTIPIVTTEITRKKQNPNWIAPPDIREFDLKTQGIVVPPVVGPGPNNPLGPYAIYMKLPTYLIHSTIFPESIGKRASFGCIRMYQFDVQTVFQTVQRGMPVVILNSPVKVGWHSDHLYMEAHPPLQEHSSDVDSTLPGIVHAITQATTGKPVLVDWQQVTYLAAARDGVPHDVAFSIR